MIKEPNGSCRQSPAGQFMWMLNNLSYQFIPLSWLFMSYSSHVCSYSKIIKVPVGWKALTKLVRWFYSGDLPNLNPDCLWNHLDPELQLEELKSYVELCSLAQFWCLEEVEEESFKALVPCISSLRVPSIELIRFAASLNQHKIVDAVVAGVASLYPKLREGGELEDLEEELVDLLRLQYVRYSQQSDTWNEHLLEPRCLNSPERMVRGTFCYLDHLFISKSSQSFLCSCAVG